MWRGLQAASAALVAEQIRQDVIAHNLANADTAGFRRIMVALSGGPPATLHRRDVSWPSLGTIGPGPQAPHLVLDLRPGELAVTDDPRDLAIEGPGVLLVEGARLSRGGRLGVDSEGFLTISGVRAEGTAGPIKIGQGPFHVLPDGTVQRDGAAIGRLRVVSVEPGNLEQAGGGLYRASGQAALKDGGSLLRQGMRERPQVNPVEELVQLIAGLRAYEAAQRAIQAGDETLGYAVNQIARVA